MFRSQRVPSLTRIIEVAKGFRSLATVGERLEYRLGQLSSRVDALASKLEDCDVLADRFEAARATEEYQAAYSRSDPLISVCIATYNRSQLVTTRAIPSILAQDYGNFELIVVGDGCTDDTPARIAKIRDSRLRFTNLPERGRYPEDPHARWMVAGSAAMNEGLRLAQGDFVTHLDDDDEHLPDRLSRLLRCAQERRADIVWHPFWTERVTGWELVNAEEFRRKQVSTGSILYHRWLARIPWDLLAYRLEEGGDWNRLRKFKYIGVNAQREPTPLLRHFRERSQSELTG